MKELPEPGAKSNIITARCIILAVLLMPANSAFLVLTEILWLTNAPTALSLFYNVVFVLFILVTLNHGLQRWKPAWAFQPAEFFVIYTMLSLSSALCSIDMLDILLPSMAFLSYFGPMENTFPNISRYVPAWLQVNDSFAAGSFFTGQESIFDSRILIPWLAPLGLWFLFIMALLAVMAGLDLIFRRPWTEHEKLAYPIIQLPMILVNETKLLLTSPWFWTGFCVIAAMDVMNGLNFFFPLLPKISVVKVVDLMSFFPERPWRDIGPTQVSFYPFAIGMCFFMPVDLAFSCWFFFFFFKFQRVVASWYGIHGMPGFPYVEEQTCGGYYALALLALWMIRRHLLRMAYLILSHPVDAEQEGERREARIAASLILVGGSFLLAFSLYFGMTLWVVIYFFAAYFLIAIAITRMRAELGYPSHDLHAIGPNLQIVKLVGAGNMASQYPRDLGMFGLYNFITRAYRSHPMPHGLEAFRIAERMGMNRNRYMAAMAIALVAGALIGYFAVLWVFTKYGGSNYSNVGEWMGREAWTKAESWFTTPERHLPHPTYAIIVGTLFALGLATFRMNLQWWPFHPVGYAVSGSWSMEQLWMCFLTAWIIKSLLLRYGGARAYQMAIPLVVGVMMGDFMVGNAWTIYGVISEQNVYRFWPY